MVGYIDTSLVLRYILEGSDEIVAIEGCESLISSELLEIEAKRVLHRCRLTGALDDNVLVEAMGELKDFLKNLDLIELSHSIKTRASEAFPTSVKTLDALHLATALEYQRVFPSIELVVFSTDKGFNRCAKSLGLSCHWPS